MWYAKETSHRKHIWFVKEDIWGIYETDNPTKEQISKYKKRAKELDNNSNSDFKYTCSDIISKIIMNCRKKEKAVEFKTKFGFNLINLILSREGSAIKIIIKPLPGVKMIEQYFIFDKRTDLHLSNPKLSIEVDEKGHIDKNKRKRRIEKKYNKRGSWM